MEKTGGVNRYPELCWSPPYCQRHPRPQENAIHIWLFWISAFVCVAACKIPENVKAKTANLLIIYVSTTITIRITRFD